MNGHKLSAIAFSAFIMAFSSHAFAGGPWVQQKNHIQMALTSAYYFYDSFYDSNRKEINLPGKVEQYEVFYNFDVGLTDKSDLSITMGFADVMAPNAVQPAIRHNVQGLDNTTIRFRKQIHNEHSAIALIAGLRLPGTYNRDYFDSPGNRALGAETGISFGEYYHERTLYWSADAIGRYNFGPPENELECNLEVGRVFDKKWLIRALSTWLYTPGGGNIEKTTLYKGTLPFYQVDKKRVNVGAGVSFLQSPDRSVGLTYVKTGGYSNTKKDSVFYLSYLFRAQ